MTEFEIKMITFLESIAVALEDIADKLDHLKADNKPSEDNKQDEQGKPVSKFDKHRNAWTQDEDNDLIVGRAYGLSFEEIVTKKMPRRTTNAARVRYQQLKKKV